MGNTLYVRMRGCEVWVEHFQFAEWDAYVRRMRGGTARDGGQQELVPGGPFATRQEAGQAGLLYARMKMHLKRKAPPRELPLTGGPAHNPAPSRKESRA